MKELTTEQLLAILKQTFNQNPKRHAGLDWDLIEKKLIANPNKILTLSKMESSGGEPDVIGYDEKKKEYIFCDCSPESPVGRRSLCFDKEALDSRKENKPSGSALEMALSIGIEILTESEYGELQKTGEYDKKTSSWGATPKEIRKLGGALFCDRRYDHVFVYHNSAESYYSARGFRGLLRV